MRIDRIRAPVAQVREALAACSRASVWWPAVDSIHQGGPTAAPCLVPPGSKPYRLSRRLQQANARVFAMSSIIRAAPI